MSEKKAAGTNVPPLPARVWSEIEDALGMNDANMSRHRPYDGQPHTDTGKRGATEIRGITFRDLRDCYIRAVLLSAHHLVPHLYEEATKGEAAALCENDLFGFDLDKLDKVYRTRLHPENSFVPYPFAMGENKYLFKGFSNRGATFFFFRNRGGGKELFDFFE